MLQTLLGTHFRYKKKEKKRLQHLKARYPLSLDITSMFRCMNVYIDQFTDIIVTSFP